MKGHSISNVYGLGFLLLWGKGRPTFFPTLSCICIILLNFFGVTSKGLGIHPDMYAFFSFAYFIGMTWYQTNVNSVPILSFERFMVLSKKYKHSTH